MIHALRQKISVLLAPASQTAAATRSANIDCLGSDYVTIVMPFAAEVNTDAVGPTIVLTESDDTTATNFATWSSSNTLTAHGLVSAHQVIFHVDTRTRKRYLNLASTTATHTTNDVVTSGAIAIFSRKEEGPVGTAGLIGSTNDSVTVL